MQGICANTHPLKCVCLSWREYERKQEEINSNIPAGHSNTSAAVMREDISLVEQIPTSLLHSSVAAH